MAQLCTLAVGCEASRRAGGGGGGGGVASWKAAPPTEKFVKLFKKTFNNMDNKQLYILEANLIKG
jgi:hypothetical protein